MCFVCARRSSSLRDEIATKSTLARTAGRGVQAPRDYLQAHASVGQIAVEERQEKVFRKKEELVRQQDERGNLSKAYKIEKGRFEAEWLQRIEAVEADCVEKERVLREVHEVALQDSEKDIEKKIAQMRYKATSTLLQLEDTESKVRVHTPPHRPSPAPRRLCTNHATEKRSLDSLYSQPALSRVRRRVRISLRD